MQPARVIIVILAILLLLAVKEAWPQAREQATTSRLTQWGTNRNATLGATNSILEATVTGVNSQRIYLYSVMARCASGPPLVTVKESAGSRSFTFFPTASGAIVNFQPAWTTALGTTLFVSMETCVGAGRLEIQADQW